MDLSLCACGVEGYDDFDLSASILLIVGLVYEHGFRISAAEAHQLQRLYHGVWIVFLADISLHIALEYKDTRRTFSRLTWILTFCFI